MLAKGGSSSCSMMTVSDNVINDLSVSTLRCIDR